MQLYYLTMFIQGCYSNNKALIQTKILKLNVRHLLSEITQIQNLEIEIKRDLIKPKWFEDQTSYLDVVDIVKDEND